MLVQFKIVIYGSVHDVAADRCLEQVSLMYCQDVWWQAVPLFDGTREEAVLVDLGICPNL